MNPSYPVYIVSKGRWNSRQTSKALHMMGVPHFMIVEQQEYDNYRAVVDDSATLLVLDSAYQDEYDTCDELGEDKSKGPGPARNFAWRHAMDAGHEWHWVMDDNIRRFYRLNRNLKIPAADGTPLFCMEQFATRYENVSMVGPNYTFFAPRKIKLPPYVLNTRIYSCNLIRNDVEFRWRGRYNEDTDLSLRMLKDGCCTVQFNAFLQQKAPTQTVRGGNTSDFYAKEGTLPKSSMLFRMHPDVTQLMWRFGRPHHYVDYSPYRANRLRRKAGIEIPTGINEYGATYQERVGERWVTTTPPQGGPNGDRPKSATRSSRAK